MNNAFEIKIIDLVRKINKLPLQDQKNIIEFAKNNEWGLALDTLVHQIYEYDINITYNMFDEIMQLGREMKKDVNLWSFLKKQVL